MNNYVIISKFLYDLLFYYKLIYLKDRVSGKFFLEYSGAALSVFSHKSQADPAGFRLTAADGRQISCWGSSWFTVPFEKQCFEWNFLLTDAEHPILGIDFLSHFYLLLDPVDRRLLNANDCSAMPTNQAPAQDPLPPALTNVPPRF